MKIKRAKLSEDSAAARYLPADVVEVLELNVSSNVQLKPDDVQIGFWTDMPAWVTLLFRLRNLLVKPFGLSGGDKNVEKFVEAIHNGTSYSMMSVIDKTIKETILRLDDKHLQAYISVYVESLENNAKQRVLVITLVKFHKRFGKFYFYAIYPFHCLIVRQQVKRIVKKLLSSGSIKTQG